LIRDLNKNRKQNIRKYEKDNHRYHYRPDGILCIAFSWPKEEGRNQGSDFQRASTLPELRKQGSGEHRIREGCEGTQGFY
jgi:hypothetical protein